MPVQSQIAEKGRTKEMRHCKVICEESGVLKCSVIPYILLQGSLFLLWILSTIHSIILIENFASLSHLISAAYSTLKPVEHSFQANFLSYVSLILPLVSSLCALFFSASVSVQPVRNCHFCWVEMIRN